ncbi:MAG: glutathione peroxidase [Crocinitomicaceae bacterium]
MKYYKHAFFTFLLLLSSLSFSQTTIYQFKVEDLMGETFDFEQYKGYKILIVNTASKCGFTPQYEDLEKLYETYKEDKFIIIGFPSNDFLKQEPGTNEEIAEFCKANYGVTFPMMNKIHVKGDEQCEIYQFLTDENLNGVSSEKVKWNFQKFLINRDGTLEKVIPSKTSPLDASIVDWIKEN